MTFAFLLARLFFSTTSNGLRGNQVASSKIWCIPSTWQQSWGQLGAWCFSPMREKPFDQYKKNKRLPNLRLQYQSHAQLKLGDDILITLKLSDPRPEALLFLTRGSCNNWVTSQNHPKPLFLHENNDPPFWMMWGSPIFKTYPSVQVHCCWCKE